MNEKINIIKFINYLDEYLENSFEYSYSYEFSVVNEIRDEFMKIFSLS